MHECSTDFLLRKSVEGCAFSSLFEAAEQDMRKLHAHWLLPVIVVRNTVQKFYTFCGRFLMGLGNSGNLC